MIEKCAGALGSSDRTEVSNVPTRNQVRVEGPEPCNSFFQASRNVTISGGQFNSTLGHHTNLTINLNQSPPIVGSELSETSIPTSTVVQDSARNTSADKYGGHLGKCKSRRYAFVHAIYQTTYLDKGQGYEHNVNTTQKHSIQPLQTPLPTLKSNEIYERHLCLKSRGFPLWIPEPNRRLPMTYRRCGISIGDVGIITPSGGFSFLFNICLPADDPINLGRVPEAFSPIHPRLEPSMDISEFSEFKQGSYLASASIEKSRNDSASSPDLSFETTASEGAILTMPEGAVSLDLENLPRFRAYATANVESWYRFVNGPRGREAKNGDIRLVTGCDKTGSWGMAALANVSQEQTNSLKFKALDNPHNASACAYTWDCSGMAEARVGPDLQEINELRRSEPPIAEHDGKYLNQCLFVRTLNVTLGHDMWEKINRELAVEYGFAQESYDGGSGKETGETPSMGNTSSNFIEERSSPPSREGGNTRLSSSTHEGGLGHLFQYYGDTGPFRFKDLDIIPPPLRLPALAESPDATSVLAVDAIGDIVNDFDKFDWTPHTFSGSSEDSSRATYACANDSKEISISYTPETSVGMHSNRLTSATDPLFKTFHPSNYLNKMLLEKNPNARLIITQDDDWTSALAEDQLTPDYFEKQLLERVMATHDALHEWDGSVSLISNKESLASDVRELLPSTSPTGERKRKYSRSCQECLRKHVKCDGNTPCDTCTLRGISGCSRPKVQKRVKVSRSQTGNENALFGEASSSINTSRVRLRNTGSLTSRHTKLEHSKPYDRFVCDFCIGRKLACNGTRPNCSQCTRRKLDCTYSSSRVATATTRTSQSPPAQPAKRHSSPALV